MLGGLLGHDTGLLQSLWTWNATAGLGGTGGLVTISAPSRPPPILGEVTVMLIFFTLALARVLRFLHGGAVCTVTCQQ